MPSTDWMPRSRQGKIDRAEIWIKALAETVTGSDGKTQKKYLLWKLSAEEMTKLGELYANAKAALDLAKDKATRTEVVNRQVEDTFGALETFLRELRLMYFHVPPLTNVDMVSLGFAVRDAIRTPLGNPTATVAARTALAGGYGQLDVFVEAVSGDLASRENQCPVYLCWLALPAGSPAPVSPKELSLDHLSSKRRKETIRFGIDKSGWDAYFCGRLEEGDRKGDWGPIVHARIP